MLSSVEVKALLKNYIVVSNPYATFNNTSHGVTIWTYTPDRKEINKFRWGTYMGDCPRALTPQGGHLVTEKWYNHMIKEVATSLRQGIQEWEKVEKVASK